MADEIFCSDPAAGAMPHGSRIITITRNGTPTAYYCDSFVPNYPSVMLRQKDNLGRARRFKGIKDFATATAVLQLETESTVVPQCGETVPAAVNDRVSSWRITQVSTPEEAEGVRLVNITLEGVPLPITS